MTSAQVLDLKGNKVREVGLDDEVFGITPNEGLMHTALVRQLANSRSGSANSKTRSEVRGGGKKPWRQKGTGRARAGSIRSPLWEGGGVIFGPKPRDFSISLPKKQRVLALKSALAAKREDLVVVQDFTSVATGDKQLTKGFAEALKQLKLDGKKVVVVLEDNSGHNKKVQLAARNIDRVVVLHVSNLNVKDLLHAESVLLTEKTLEVLHNRFKNLPQEKAAPEKKKAEIKPKAAKPAKETEAKAAPEKKPKAKAEDGAAAKKAEAPKETKKSTKKSETEE
jgi:large subunit ribosomal protein L4